MYGWFLRRYSANLKVLVMVKQIKAHIIAPLDQTISEHI